MQFTTLSLTALLSLTLATPTPNLLRRDCFPATTQTLISTSQVRMGDVLNNIYEADKTTGKASMASVEQALDNLQSTLPSTSCDLNVQPWNTSLSLQDQETKAIGILRTSQDNLRNMGFIVEDCATDKAVDEFCAVRFDIKGLEGYFP